MVLFDRYKFINNPDPGLTFRNNIDFISSRNELKKIFDKNSTLIDKCPICKNNNFKLIASTESLGFNIKTVICKYCTLIFTQNPPNSFFLNLLYEYHYENLTNTKNDLLSLENEFNKQKNKGKTIANYLIYNNLNLSNMTVLDIGSGIGGILKSFTHLSSKAYGFDYPSIKTQFAKGKNLSFVSNKDKILDQSIDLIIYCHVLEHIKDLDIELNFISRVLKKEGIVYIEVPGINNIKSYNYNYNLMHYLQIFHLFHFSKHSLNNLLMKHSFECISVNEKIFSIYKKTNIKNFKIQKYNYKIVIFKFFYNELIYRAWVLLRFCIKKIPFYKKFRDKYLNLYKNTI